MTLYKRLLIIIFLSVAAPVMLEAQETSNKLIIYQLLPRLFGNKQTNNIHYGTIEQNGSGKFNDITVKALIGIKELGTTHVWYTGVIAHASLTDYTAYGIPNADGDVVKGRAGSPYAIRDYYDVDPDLAVDVKHRMAEFESLVKRTHQQGLKVIIDFVPNHVARKYQSNAKPAGVIDFGAKDNTNLAFSPANDYYYVPGKAFVVPGAGTQPTGPLADGKYQEFPAKATGNDVFSATPSKDDWYETVKLNYGVDYQDGRKGHFNPVPQLWIKMRDILIYWSRKGVDGFRCDMAEMVPVEFWSWVIPEVKKAKPGIVFMGEAYDPKTYATYLTIGKFDYLYDKVGLYDGLKRLMRNEPSATVADIDHVWQKESAGFGDHMLRFLENHDEERIASKTFAGDPFKALPAMTVSSTLSGGPVMLYFGQEVGEPAHGAEGFGGEDSRTTIFDYWGVPEHQKWMNNGSFDGAQLSVAQQRLRSFYQRLLTVSGTSEAIIKGKFYHLPFTDHPKIYAFYRYTANQRLLVLVNFDEHDSIKQDITIPEEVLQQRKINSAKEILSGTSIRNNTSTSVYVELMPGAVQIIEF
ncbi:glycosidase [Pedobacter duraquae]|uniref:Glycosidase n=2 Tax=Pedobacter duraquae TaxID=425511 RepID=A0A4R6IIG0_9SPHI|nr:glycosidase [Pedobacter duraquae]